MHTKHNFLFFSLYLFDGWNGVRTDPPQRQRLKNDTSTTNLYNYRL